MTSGWPKIVVAQQSAQKSIWANTALALAAQNNIASDDQLVSHRECIQLNRVNTPSHDHDRQRI